jgi:drug/metabolite transporter (DMT)-like permease
VSEASEVRRTGFGIPDPNVKREHVLLGIAYMIASTIVFSVSSAISKWLVATYPIGEVLFSRSLISLGVCALIILPTTGLAVFHTERVRHHAMRSFSQFLSQTFLVIAFSLMPLASAVAINFSAPLFTSLLSMYLLKEHVGAARWAALVVGFVGVLIVTNPGAETFSIGALFALANAVIYGSVTAAVRGMTKTESAETLTLYQLVMISGFFACLLPLGVIVPTWADAGLIAVNGIMNGIGQYWWTRALHLAPASAVTPFFYFMLVWAILLGFVVWGDVPTLHLLLGSVVVVGSGLFLLWRESTRR